MAQIVTTNTRPQFATVRYKVMDAPARQEEASGEVKVRPVPKSALKSAVTHVNTQPVPAGKGLGDQCTTDWPVRAHGASAADYHLRGERSDPVCSLHERQRTYRGHQQRRAGTDF